MTVLDRFRGLPAVGKLIHHPALANAAGAAAVLRDELHAVRQRLAADTSLPLPSDHEIAANAAARLLPKLRRVLNATGIVLHTNLGRSVLHPSAFAAAAEAAGNYCNLELDLGTGQRSNRQDAVRAGLCRLTGAAAATVVNNCAAATVLTLRALAAGREVVVSRGQLVEIGGGFRIPEILQLSGATLVEVGTTNITRLWDYEAAITSRTAVLLRVHASNFRVTGHTESVGIAELAALGAKHGLAVVDDVGSGLAVDLAPFGLGGEPLVGAGVAAGATVVLFSGDKLLGGPQCGVIAGTKDAVAKLERDPFFRAVRTDKMTLAALDATVRLYADPAAALREIPTLRMLTTPYADLRHRCEAFAATLTGLNAEVIDDVSFAGGGSFPDVAVPTAVIAIRPPGSEAEFAASLRRGRPAVMVRVNGGRVLLDLRCVPAADEAALRAVLLL